MFTASIISELTVLTQWLSVNNVPKPRWIHGSWEMLRGSWPRNIGSVGKFSPGFEKFRSAVDSQTHVCRWLHMHIRMYVCRCHSCVCIYIYTYNVPIYTIILHCVFRLTVCVLATTFDHLNWINCLVVNGGLDNRSGPMWGHRVSEFT